MQIGGKYREVAQRCQLFGAAAVDSLLGALFPWACALCGREGAGFDLCIACLDELPWLQGVHDPGFSALSYAPPVDAMITALKYHRRRVHGRVLGELLAIRALELLRDGQLRLPDCLIPVPLHPRRLLTRGYNQAALIARPVGRALALPVRPRLLRRAVHSDSQTQLGRGRRLRNPAGMFSARPAVAGARVAVIDDVVTTGATLSDCRRALLDAGAASVSCWTVARAQLLMGSKV